MRADNALSHLYDRERCIAVLQDGSKREVWWSRDEWTFFYPGSQEPLRFEHIKEWRPASIDPH
ncbi:hypothetical protein [Noviherbaspirillum denitrificans]|uniref:DUF551 domain-containing protein n=1 Tax=Noviherbaspirillum denitrificans TaxID=1968433 RepID=A0A254TIT0_9BURK|nr:hypothetical protein [Noviherbaspirillum denitrificans]OWW22117.1 hypothetical protein AYR66_24095 [Noviherbaspirillum denitrificans]